MTHLVVDCRTGAVHEADSLDAANALAAIHLAERAAADEAQAKAEADAAAAAHAAEVAAAQAAAEADGQPRIV